MPQVVDVFDKVKKEGVWQEQQWQNAFEILVSILQATSVWRDKRTRASVYPSLQQQLLCSFYKRRRGSKEAASRMISSSSF